MWAVGHARLTTNARLAILLHFAVSLLTLLPSLLAGLLCRAVVAAFALSIAMLLSFAWAAVFLFSLRLAAGDCAFLSRSACVLLLLPSAWWRASLSVTGIFQEQKGQLALPILPFRGRRIGHWCVCFVSRSFAWFRAVYGQVSFRQESSAHSRLRWGVECA